MLVFRWTGYLRQEEGETKGGEGSGAKEEDGKVRRKSEGDKRGKRVE